MHLIAWDKVTKAKKQGGLGFKNLRQQNKAFIMKLCWSLLTKRHALWVQCIWAKYNCGSSLVPKVEKKRSSSSAWRAIVEVWDKFIGGVGRKVNNRADTKFWRDLWLPLERPLLTYVHNPASINEEESVKDHILMSGQWDMSRWNGILPFEVIRIISRMHPPNNNSPYCFTWRVAKDGGFSVKSAYHYLSGRTGDNNNRF